MNDTDAFFTSVGDIHNLHSKIEVFWGLLVVDLVSKPVELAINTAVMPKYAVYILRHGFAGACPPTTRLASFSISPQKTHTSILASHF